MTRFGGQATEIPTGAQVYERMVVDALSSVIQVNPALCDPLTPRWLRYKKLRFAWQNKFSLPSGDLLITDSTQFYSGLNINRFSNRILLLHHMDARDTPRPFVQERVDNYVKQNLSRFDHLVVIADYWKNHLSAHMPGERISVVHCAYDIEFVLRQVAKDKRAAREELGLPQDKIVVYAGQAGLKKGIKAVAAKLPPERFHIVTTGRIEFDGGQDHRELSQADYLKLVSVADLAIFLPEYNEGWTRAAHEALLCGVPVIGRDRGGLGDLVRGAGQVMCDSDDDLLACVDRALVDREKLVASGKAFAEQFTVERFNSQWRGVIEKVCGTTEAKIAKAA